MFKTSLEFEAYLRLPEFKGTRLMYEVSYEVETSLLKYVRLIPQRFSWDNLLISESGLKLLLSASTSFQLSSTWSMHLDPRPHLKATQLAPVTLTCALIYPVSLKQTHRLFSSAWRILNCC